MKPQRQYSSDSGFVSAGQLRFTCLLVRGVFLRGVVGLYPCGIVTGMYGAVTRASHLRAFSIKTRGRR